MALRWNPKTGRYEDPNSPPVPTAPARPVRGKPNINLTQAVDQGWGLLQSPRPIEQKGRAAASSMYDSGTGDTTMEDVLNKYFGTTTTGTGVAGPTTAQKRAGGMQAARILEQAGQRGQRMYGNQADQLAQQLGDIYNPFYAQQEGMINDQQKRAMDFLAAQYGGNQQTIQDATQAALAGVPASAAYQNVPIVNLQQEQNPLLNALGAYGAGTQGVQAQSAADAQMAQQLADLVKGSAGQMSSAQQAVLDAAKSDIQSGGSQALQQLALAKQAQEAGITSEKQRALNEMAGSKAGTQADIAAASQALLSKGIESLLGGMTDAATQRAKTVADYGPTKKKAKSPIKKLKK